MAETYYIDPVLGDDENDGKSPGNAWEHISKANSTLVASDKVYLMAGTYTTFENRIIPANSGSIGNPITYQNYQNDVVTLKEMSCAIVITLKDYIIVDGIDIYGDSIASNNIPQFLALDDAEYCQFKNATWEYAGGWSGAAIQNGSQYNKILNMTMRYIGEREPPEDDDLGNLLEIKESDNNLIQGCNLYFAGHDLLRIRNSNKNIVKDCILDNLDWGRCAAHYHKTPGVYKYNFFIGNTIRNSSLWNNNNVDTPNVGMQCSFSYAIWRNNIFHDNIGDALQVFCTEPDEGSHNRIFNNVFYNNGHNAAGNDGWGVRIWDMYYGTDPAEMQDNVIKNNILRANALTGIRFENGDSGKHTEVDNWIETDGDPKFINEDNKNFLLQSDSPCINNGGFLTLTNGSGSGTSMTVDDASYFCDGFGLIEGDYIQLDGQTIARKITNINYDTNVITLESPGLTWDDDQGVALPYYGTAPDQGAYEYEGEVTLQGAVGAIASVVGGTKSLRKMIGSLSAMAGAGASITVTGSGQISDYLENALLDHVFKTTEYTPPANIYVALTKSTIDDTHTGSTLPSEVSGGNYARKLCNTWDVASGGKTENSQPIVFNKATANWGIVTYFAVCDQLSGGNVLFYGALHDTKVVNLGDTFRFKTEDLDMFLN